MRLCRLLTLPPALLTLVFDRSCPTHAQELAWPYNLAPHVKYYPEDEALVKRNAEIQQKLQGQRPVGMKKMSGDPGEKFLLEYWQFELGDTDYGNASTVQEFDAPLKVHETARRKRSWHEILGLRMLDERDFQCPAGSQACTDIGRPDSCCAIGSTCQLVQDVGLGDVGCCPGDEVCGGSVTTCPSGGYTDCPQNPGGGCCLPGYACFQEGCAATSTAVVIVTPSPTSTSSPSASSSSSAASTTVAPPPPSSSSSRPSTTAAPSSSSTPPNTLACSSGFRSCPASLGGGCCPTDRACGRDVCPELSSTNSFTAPGRPTTDSASATITHASSTSLTSISGYCPTGFYACSAYYQGGCCQTGRNCDTTSCPAGHSITVIDGGTITAVAPTGSGVSSVQTLLTGRCAGGWSSCAASVGGGCCPAGYACGGAACTATGTGGQNSTIGKIAPNGGGRVHSHFALVVIGALLFGFTMDLDVIG